MFKSSTAFIYEDYNAHDAHEFEIQDQPAAISICCLILLSKIRANFDATLSQIYA